MPRVHVLAALCCAALLSAPAARAASHDAARTTAVTDTFVWGPWDFESGWQGWTANDSTTNSGVSPHIADLSGVPGSAGNGALFTGNVCWFGSTGVVNACGRVKGCFPGYDNGLWQVAFKTVTVQAGDHLHFAYRCDSEPGYDVVYLLIGTAPAALGGTLYAMPARGTFGAFDTLATYSGIASGVQDFDLSAFAGQTVSVIFDGETDTQYSDGDCGRDSHDGLFELDDVALGADLTTWDAGANGWTFGRVQQMGLHAKLAAWASLPLMTFDCRTPCQLAGSVALAGELTSPYHPAWDQYEQLVSPVVDLTQCPGYPASKYEMQYDLYEDSPILCGVSSLVQVRYSPYESSDCACLDTSAWSPWVTTSTSSGDASTTTAACARRLADLSTAIPAHAQRLQVALAVQTYYAPADKCFFAGSPAPYWDNISVRAAENSAPAIALQSYEFLHDAFPHAATFALAKSTPAKMDEGLNVYPNKSRTRLGDSLTCTIATSCTPEMPAEVDYLIRVTPGPCLDTAHPWWQAYLAQPKIASGPYAGFAVARADTAQTSPSGPPATTSTTSTFMSCFHESPPAAGTRYAGLGDWSALTAGAENLALFPDDLFTPGTHIEYVVHSTFIPSRGDEYAPNPFTGDGDGDRAGATIGDQRWPSQGGTYDPAAVYVEEATVLPLTTRDGTSDCAGAQPAHCFLYVDHADHRGVQPAIDNALRNLGVACDRFDVRASSSGMGNDLGSRFDPANYALGDHAPGPLPSLMAECYSTMLWSTGTLISNNLSYGSTSSGANAGNAVSALDGWLRTADGKTRMLWLSGDGNARFLNATGPRLTFLNTTLGATYQGAAYSAKNAAWGVTLSGLGPDCTAGQSYGLRGNACPDSRSYNYIAKYTGATAGAAATNLKYPDASGTWYAGVQDVASTTALHFRTQLDGFSVEQLRQPGVAQGNEVLGAVEAWMGTVLSQCSPTGCLAPGGAVGVDGSHAVAVPAVSALVRGGAVEFRLVAVESGRATLRVFDVSGRQVAVPVDRALAAGTQTVRWQAGAHPGVYFYEYAGPGLHVARKLLVVR